MAKLFILFLVLTLYISTVYPGRGFKGRPNKFWKLQRPFIQGVGGWRGLPYRPPVEGIQRRTSTPCVNICISFLGYFIHQRDAHYNKVGIAERFCQIENLQEDECNQLVSNARMIGALASVSSYQPSWRGICQSPGICPKQNGIECSACQSIVYAIQIAIKVSNASEKVIINTVKFMCKTMAPLKIQYQMCELILKDIDEVYKYIVQKMDPKDVCVKIGACTNSSRMVNLNIHRALFGYTPKREDRHPRIPGIMEALIEHSDHATAGAPLMLGLMEMKRHPMRDRPDNCFRHRCHHDHRHHHGRPHHHLRMTRIRPFAAKKIRSNPMQCVICKSVITVVSATLKITNYTIEEVLKQVKIMCHTLAQPSTAAVCDNVVKKVDLIVQLIAKKLKPDQICVKLGYCSENRQHRPYTLLNKMRTVKKLIRVKVRPRILHKASTTCKVCDSIKENVNTTLAAYVEEMSDAKQNLTDLCNLTKNESSKSKCLSAVSVLNMMETNVVEKLIPTLCESIKCTGMTSRFDLPMKDKRSCQKCTKITSVVEEQLKYVESIVSMILKDVSTLCLEFTEKETADRCDAIVNKTKAIMDFIEKRVNPKGICRVLGICKLEETELDNMSKMKFVRKWKKSGKKSPKQRMRSLCRLCKATLKFIRENKGTLSTTEVKAGLQKRCLEITGNRGAEKCDKITKRIDEIMAKEKTGADADQICEEMQLCGAPRETGPKKIARFFHKIEKFAEEA